MKTTIDEARNILILETQDGSRELPLYSDEAFRELARLYVKVNWNQKYSYTFSWLGRPIIQLPDDVLRIQELIYAVQPDVIIETGVAHGGSLIFYASLCCAMGRGRVVGIDIEVRPHNRAAIETHRLSSYIELIEGSSTAPETLEAVRKAINPGERTLIILDSNHSYTHVSEELALYSPLVSPGSYILATDGIMSEVADTPRGTPSWRDDNPTRAALDFVAANPGFRMEPPVPSFNEGTALDNVTYWPGAYIRRIG
ncbi:cephalosporin hydroxylase family protein [Microvirga subterranea]|uniref:Cephalosporin hydroxylase n=1 Tax=Microvirga subterranea TaxID=186651 RepID=A0A370HCN5_9HYPH|nr:CmcI family methyltransferase [Microvirga subterranea]RDI54838.1 cephalosporin hydroxylase [Microvirga subterranea]